jgi:hypothetical protein
MAGEIDVAVAGVHAATLSAEEAALLADALWDLGAEGRWRGAIALAGALKAAAHGSLVHGRVDVETRATAAVDEALRGLAQPEGEHGLADLGGSLAEPERPR